MYNSSNYVGNLNMSFAAFPLLMLDWHGRVPKATLLFQTSHLQINNTRDPLLDAMLISSLANNLG